MDRADLAKLEAAATPGPWRYEYSTVDDLHWGAMGAHLLHRGRDTNYVAHDRAAQVGADFALAAATRNVLPVLLRRLDLAEQTLAAVLTERHTKTQLIRNAPAVCARCAHPWPCPGENARAALAELRRPLDQPDDTT